MNKFIAVTLILFLGAIAGATHFKAKNMLEIKFKLGENIVITARQTNIPEFNVSNTNGLLQYQVMQLPSDAIAIYDRPGFEIRSGPIFSLNFRADRARSKIDGVHAFQVKIDTKDITNHQSAREFVETIISQFRSGKWQRRLSVYCPAVTGRSVFITVEGAIDSDGCALDPNFVMSEAEWKKLFADGQNFEWLGDGVFAQLAIKYNDRTPQPLYEIFLRFEDYKTKLTVIRENEKRRIEEGDAKGWESSAITARDWIATEKTNRVLEANALKRGDKVLVRVPDPE